MRDYLDHVWDKYFMNCLDWQGEQEFHVVMNVLDPPNDD